MADEKVTIPIEIDITDLIIGDILITAIEGGITHWAESMKVVLPDKQESKAKGIPWSVWAGTALNSGGEIQFIDENDDKFSLTKAKMISGITQFIKENNWVIDFSRDTKTAYIDPANLDAGDADCIIQYALFGQLVYG